MRFETTGMLVPVGADCFWRIIVGERWSVLLCLMGSYFGRRRDVF